MDMYCKNCNEFYPEGSKFCKSCGKPLSPAKSERLWFVNDGAQKGPFLEEEIISQIKKGTWPGTVWVVRSGMDQWVLLNNSELSRYLPEPQTTESGNAGQDISGEDGILSLMIFEALEGIAILIQLFSLFFFSREIHSFYTGSGSIWALLIIITSILFTASMPMANWFLVKASRQSGLNRNARLFYLAQMVINFYPFLLVLFGFLAGTQWVAVLMTRL